MRYSLVVPAYNEEESLRELHAEIATIMDGLPEHDGGALAGDWELVFVDDGSSDGTVGVMRELAAADSRVVVVEFVRNFGKSAAYMAGFEAARGDIVVTLDADLQDDPNEIPAMVETLLSGHDLVIGWKQGRLQNEPHKKIPSRVFNGLIGLLFGTRFHDNNCGFRVMHRRVAESLELYGDNYRFIPQFAHVSGFSVVEQGVHHRKRKHGYSKYGPKRFWTGLLDLATVRFITAFGQKPLHFFGTFSLLPFTLGGLLFVYVLGQKLVLGSPFSSHVAAILTGVMLVIMGFQGLITGLIGEMLSAQQRSRRFIVASHDAKEAR